MPWAGGTYTKGNNATGGWTGDATLGIGIEAGRHDTQDNDFATGINNCLTKDGTNSATADLNLGGFKPINIAAGTAAAPAVCVGNDINTGMYSPAADTIAWATNGVERTRLNNIGRLLIGRTTELGASERILIGPSTGQNWATVDGGSTNANDGSAFVVATGGVSRAAFGVYSAIVGGAYDSTATLYSSGAGYKVVSIQPGVGTWPMKWNASTAAWTYDTSRRSAKENIRDSIYGLAAVKQLQPRQFNYLASEQFREDVGFIADEVYSVIPELAPVDEAGEPAGVSYDRLTAVLCKAIQELAARVEALEAAQGA